MFTTPNAWIVLALTFLGGWLLGLATHPGGRKWKARYAQERDAHAVSRRDYEAKLTAAEAQARDLAAERTRAAQAEARIAEIERERDAHAAELGRRRDDQAGELARGRESLSLAQARIRELERENDRLRTAPQPLAESVPATHRQATVAAPAPAETMPLTRRVVSGGRSSRGWFDWGPSGDPRAHRG